MKKLWFSLLSVIFLAAAPMWAAEPKDTDALAITLLAKAGLRAGVCEVPRAGDGALVLALARQSELVVHAMDDDAGRIAAARTIAGKAGLLGRRIYLEQGRIDAVPMADHYVDLLIIADLTDADLTAALAEEIARVLTPCRGTALIGMVPGDTANRLSEAALKTWLAKISLPETENSKTIIRDPALGLWAMIHMPALAGADDWTHLRHRADNNVVSQDKIMHWPALTQFWGLPYYGSQTEGAVSAGGRHFECVNYRGLAGETGKLRARSLYNGQILWEHDLPPGLRPGAQNMVATPQALYIVLSTDTPEISVLDPETGNLREKIKFDQTKGQMVQWLAMEGDVLYAMYGEPGKAATNWLIELTEGPCMGKNLAAYDLKAGKLLWSHSEETAIDYRNLAIADGKVIFCTEAPRVVGLDARTGQQLWENHDAAWTDKKAKTDPSIQLSRLAGIVASPEVFYLRHGTLRLFFATPTGKFLSQHPAGAQVIGFIMDGKVYEGSVFDPVADKIVAKGINMGRWCGTRTVGGGFLLGQYDGRSWDFASSKGLNDDSNVKAPCALGNWVAGGVQISSPSACQCGPHLRGAISTAPGGHWLEDFSQRPAHPRDAGPGDPTAVTPVEMLDGDWPTYRANNSRNAFVPVEMAKTAKLLWTQKPAVPFEFVAQTDTYSSKVEHHSAAPIAAGGMVFMAATDGSIQAFDATSGERAWTFQAGGPIYTAPTFWQGRLFAGAADGYVYALEAKTGRLLWRCRVAPLDRRIMVFGMLQNTWPLLGGVLVHQGVVYAAAGMYYKDGAQVMALDALTGQEKWNTLIAPNAAGWQDHPELLKMTGAMAVVGDKLWVSTYLAPGVFDLATGKQSPPADLTLKIAKLDFWQLYTRETERGRDLVVVGDRYVLQGGHLLFGSDSERSGVNRFRARAIGSQGDLNDTIYPATIAKSHIAPATDGQVMALVPGPDSPAFKGKQGINGTTGLAVWDAAKFDTRLAEAQQKMTAAYSVADRKFDDLFSQAGLAVWEDATPQVNAVALTRNAVVSTEAASPIKRGPVVLANWRVAARNRESGELLWSIPIPGEPSMGGLAVDHAGRVIVTLRDGGVVCVGNGN